MPPSHVNCRSAILSEEELDLYMELDEVIESVERGEP